MLEYFDLTTEIVLTCQIKPEYLTFMREIGSYIASVTHDLRDKNLPSEESVTRLDAELDKAVTMDVKLIYGARYIAEFKRWNDSIRLTQMAQRVEEVLDLQRRYEEEESEDLAEANKQIARNTETIFALHEEREVFREELRTVNAELDASHHVHGKEYEELSRENSELCTTVRELRIDNYKLRKLYEEFRQ